MVQGDPIQTRELTVEKFGMGLKDPIVAPVLATGTGKTVDNVITELQNLGLLTQT